MEKQIVILGAGAAGLGANYSLKQKGYNPIVLEKDETYGGLCGNFMIAGFRFDRFVHFDFTQIDDVFNIFKKSTDMYIHQSNPFNIYNGIWIKHPAQNNLYPLSEEEKRLIVCSSAGENISSGCIYGNVCAGAGGGRSDCIYRCI